MAVVVSVSCLLLQPSAAETVLVSLLVAVEEEKTMLQVLYFSSLPFLNATVLFHTPHHIPFHLSSV
jgi:hypothetical protein